MKSRESKKDWELVCGPWEDYVSLLAEIFFSVDARPLSFFILHLGFHFCCGDGVFF